MKIPATLPITAEQSRAARFQLGLTQANVIEESDLPGHKLKQFETGRFVPDMPFLEKLKAFYEGKGVELTPAQAATSEPQAKPGASMVASAHAMYFRINPSIEQDQLDSILGRMDANDERIAAILPLAITAGFLSKFDADTDAKQRELFGAMAENYLLFRILQGRNILKPIQAADEAQTHADVVASFFAQSPLATVIVPSLPASTSSDEGGEG